MSTTDSDDLFGCTECGHRATRDEMDEKPVFQSCLNCGASGNNRGYYPVWECPNCESQYIGSRPSAGSGGVKGCNRCFTAVPENYLREAIETGDASLLEPFLPSGDRAMFEDN